jgi:DNA polymerase-1
METNGIRIDPALLLNMSGDFEKQIESLTQRAFELAGMEFNINSPKQLGEVLFEKLNLPAPKKLKKSGQYSTSVEILEQLALQYELAASDARISPDCQVEDRLCRRSCRG